MSKFFRLSLLSILINYIVPTLNAQTVGRPYKSQSIGVDINVFDMDVSYEMFLNKHLALDINAGFLSSGIELRAYFIKPKKGLNLAMGVNTSYSYPSNYFYGDHVLIQTPLMLSYVTNKSLEFSLNFGLGYAVNYVDTPGIELSIGNSFFLAGGISIGYRFGSSIDDNNTNPTELRNIWGADLGTTGSNVGVFYQRLLSPSIGLEARLGALGGSIGMNFYMPGLSPAKIGFVTGAQIGNGIYLGKSVYVPIGIYYMSGLSRYFSITAGPENSFHYNQRSVGFSLKAGKLF